MQTILKAITLLISGIVLLYLLTGRTNSTAAPDPIRVTVEQRIVTQSLDGHRHYITFSHQGEHLRLNIDPNARCEAGDIATLQPISTLFGQNDRLQLIKCQTVRS
ncbi:hypothetical protein [Vibrio sp. SCSIO 43136]|uniref:hypothetical protein n=1 Tax=Vibrio sp. SCSIO 43136 TaxID=2819101 RepID=UPI0020758C53|nr:hypothetical protein [Vibrio sp. SCSIO 43136]USD67953.1 hypothetical protein J4N39_17395 [Vibrio sp. SCSIO 43136]